MDKASVVRRNCQCSHPSNQSPNVPTINEPASICIDRRAVITPHSMLPEETGSTNGQLLQMREHCTGSGFIQILVPNDPIEAPPLAACRLGSTLGTQSTTLRIVRVERCVERTSTRGLMTEASLSDFSNSRGFSELASSLLLLVGRNYAIHGKVHKQEKK